MERIARAYPSFVAGAVVGGAIGAVVALLMAPRSGEETRKILKKKTDKLGKEIKEMKDELVPKIKTMKQSFEKKLGK